MCNGPSLSNPGQGQTNGSTEFYKCTNRMDKDGPTRALQGHKIPLRH